jgi:hypothetical protein
MGGRDDGVVHNDLPGSAGNVVQANNVGAIHLPDHCRPRRCRSVGSLPSNENRPHVELSTSSRRPSASNARRYSSRSATLASIRSRHGSPANERVARRARRHLA